MYGIDADTLPAWLVVLNMIAAGVMLRVAYIRNIRVLTTLYLSGTTMLVESLVYAVIQSLSIDPQIRGFIIKMMLIVISMSFYIPLFVSYLRSRHRDN